VKKKSIVTESVNTSRKNVHVFGHLTKCGIPDSFLNLRGHQKLSSQVKLFIKFEMYF